MIKIDLDKNEFNVEGDFETVISEVLDILNYCVNYYVNSVCEQGDDFDAAKERMKSFLLDMVEQIVEDIKLLPDPDTPYTS